MGILRLLGFLVNMVAARLGESAVNDLGRLKVLYSHMDDEHLRAELRLLYDDQAQVRPVTFLQRLLSKFQDSPALHALAIGVCLFNRYPCDLPAGSTAYDEQERAALMLLGGVNVQMETGEGKTYAIVLAATALLAEHPQVVVITANQYLARRDLARVKPYFDAAGISCAYGTQSPEFRGVAYASMSDLCFGYLERTYRRPESKLADYTVKAAVIIDEIDSVLLDQPLVRALSRRLPGEESLWAAVFGLADGWTEGHYTHDPVSDGFSLTAGAWDDLARVSQETGKPMSLVMRLAVAALWVRHAEEGRHYALSDGKSYLINQVTGEEYETDDPRSSALEYLHTGRTDSILLSVAQINGLTLLQRHPHVVGLSGTAVQDTVYYLQQLRTFTAPVPARFPRYQGKVATTVATSADAAFRHIAARIEEVQPRPVVIGTWSPAQARRIAARLLAERVVDPARLGVVTAFGAGTDQALLVGAGEPARVTVLSQGGSRGVDVRSTHRPLLLVLGRAVEPRLDRQFLGRVGRHGEPFEAEFILDPESPVQIPVRLVKKILGDDTMPAPAPVVRGIATRQRDLYVYRVRRRYQSSVLSRAVGEVEASVAATFRHLNHLDGDAGLRGYVTELCGGTDAGSGDAASAGEADPVAAEARVVTALDRREESDGFVSRFETAAQAVGIEMSDDTPYELHTTIAGAPTEIAALTRWLTGGTTILLAPDADQAQAKLFHYQATLAAAQWLPVPTSPHQRSPVRVIYETRLMANATLLEQTSQRLESLWITSRGDAYYRRGAFTARNLYKLSALSVRHKVIANLSVVDRPATLDDLFYTADHMIGTPGNRDQGVTPTAAPTTPTTTPAFTETEAETLISRFLTAKEQESGGLAIPPDSARLLLLDVLQPLHGTADRLSTGLLRQRVTLLLDSLAAKGTRGGKLRDHRRLMYQFTDSLYDQGLLNERMPRETAITSMLRRTRSFVATVPPAGVAAILAYLGIMALGGLFVATPVRHSGTLDAAAQLFGFGSVLPNHPFLTFFAVLIVLQAAVFACGFLDPAILVMRFGPLVAIAVGFICYNRGLANLGWTALLVLGLIFWFGLAMMTQRFVITFVGTDTNLILAAASVAVYIVSAAAHGHAQACLFIAIGIAAAASGPAIPVSIGAREYATGGFRHADERARVRVAVDPAVTSGLVAFALIGLIAHLRGDLGAWAFTLTQLLILLVIASRRLSVTQIKGMLAKLQVGTLLPDDQFRRHLRWDVAKSGVVAAAALAAAATANTLTGQTATLEFLLQEWAGVALLIGLSSLGTVLSIAGSSMPIGLPDDDDKRALARLRALREQLRAWRRMRFAWVWKTALTVIVIFGILRWISDLFGVADVTRSLWHLIMRLFH